MARGRILSESRGEVGITAVVYAALVGLSTLFTKQHYVLDVIAGVFLACVAYVVFLRSYHSEEIPDRDRLVAPFLALIVVAIVGLVFMCYVVAYAFGVELSGTRL